MRRATLLLIAVALGALAALWLSGGEAAATLDCKSRRLTAAESAICQDPQLGRTEQQVVGRVKGMARRMSLGQYLGLRHWHAGWGQERTRCGTDRTCLANAYRAQHRFLDRLQQCLETSSPRRACLRTTLNVEAAQRP